MGPAMSASIPFWGRCVAVLTLFASVASADSISDSSPQFNPNGASFDAPGETILIGTFDFTGQPFGSFVGIDDISIRLTMDDGDTAAGDFDFNDVNLQLDGIETGGVTCA